MVGHFQEFEDEYLEMMYEFHEAEPGGVVRTGDLAAKLSVGPASATEMVQRLATRGLEYIPYKGTINTQGLTHGQKMKRRHRLAGLLDMLPYTVTARTACRLEHAIDDDMEVALSRLITEDTLDPSGRTIPEPTADIVARLQTGQMNHSLGDMDVGAAGRLSMLLLPAHELATLNKHGFAVGARLHRTTNGFTLENGWTAQLSDTAMQSVFVEIETPSV